MRAGSLDGSKNRGQIFPFSRQDSKRIVSNNLEDRKIEGSRNDGTVPGRYVIQLVKTTCKYLYICLAASHRQIWRYYIRLKPAMNVTATTVKQKPCVTVFSTCWISLACGTFAGIEQFVSRERFITVLRDKPRYDRHLLTSVLGFPFILISPATFLYQGLKTPSFVVRVSCQHFCAEISLDCE